MYSPDASTLVSPQSTPVNRKRKKNDGNTVSASSSKRRHSVNIGKKNEEV